MKALFVMNFSNTANFKVRGPIVFMRLLQAALA